MAHAAVISLKHTIQRLLFLTNLPIASSLHLLEGILPYLDGSSKSISKRSAIIALEAEIKEAAWKLEDILECYALHHSLPPPQDLADFPAGEKEIEEDTSSFFAATEKLKELHEQLLKEEEEEDDETDDDDDTDDFAGKNTPRIGFSDQFDKITNELLDGTRGLKSVSIVGMAGIGKTRLAREIIQHQNVARTFDLILLVRVGQKAQIEDAIVDIVAQVERRPKNLYMGKDVCELMELLQNCLNGRSYLIVLDDIWSTDFFDFWMTWVRPYGKQKRLLLTTRLEDVGKSHNTKIHRIPFLDNEESWKLLRQNVFGDDYLPPELEEVGKKIAENCEGLPLLILAIASILCLEEKTEEHWKKVANKKTTTFTDAYDMISKRLFSSYEHLPSHLKPCFLYMGVFPQTFKIPLPKLVNLWIVEDFLDPYEGRNLEDLCMEYMKKLVSNSLVIVCKQSCSPANKIKSSKLHSAYWYLCVKEARKDKLFHALNKLTDAAEEFIEKQRRLAVQTNLLFGIKEVHESIAAASTARSLLCTGEDQQYPVPICYNLMSLRVLDAVAIRLYDFPEEVVKLLLLRYLSLTHNGKVPPSISHLQKLQCLVVRLHHNIKILRDSSPKNWWECQRRGLRYSTSLPEEIWDMQELKHIRILGRNLPNPGLFKRLLKLSTLYVNAHSCSWGVFRSIPNLAKLGIEIELQPDSAQTLNCLKHVNLLHRLESLKCFIVNPFLRSRALAPPHHLSNLPTSLKKLSLNGLGYPWKSMSRIGSLPNLEVLKLRCSAFQGPEWEAEAGEFPSLQLILLEDMDLVQWTIHNDEWLPSFRRQICGDDCLSRFGMLMKRLVYNESCFRRLQRLIFRHCYRLKEIPLEIGEIPTVERIEVVDCSTSAVDSALLLKERNSSIEVEISFHR